MVLGFQSPGVGVKPGFSILRRVWATSPRAVRAGKLFEHATHVPTKPVEPTANKRRRVELLPDFFKWFNL